MNCGVYSKIIKYASISLKKIITVVVESSAVDLSRKQELLAIEWHHFWVQ